MNCAELNINELDTITGGQQKESVIPASVKAGIISDAQSFKAKGYDKNTTASMLVKKYKVYPVNEVLSIVNSVYCS